MFFCDVENPDLDVESMSLGIVNSDLDVKRFDLFRNMDSNVEKPAVGLDVKSIDLFRNMDSNVEKPAVGRTEPRLGCQRTSTPINGTRGGPMADARVAV